MFTLLVKKNYGIAELHVFSPFPLSLVFYLNFSFSMSIMHERGYQKNQRVANLSLITRLFSGLVLDGKMSYNSGGTENCLLYWSENR